MKETRTPRTFAEVPVHTQTAADALESMERLYWLLHGIEVLADRIENEALPQFCTEEEAAAIIHAIAFHASAVLGGLQEASEEWSVTAAT